MEIVSIKGSCLIDLAMKLSDDLDDEIGNRTLNKKTPDFTFLGVKSGVCFVKH